MKKNKTIIFCLSIVSILGCINGLTSCNQTSSTTSSSNAVTSSSSVISSSSNEEVISSYSSIGIDWTSSQKELLIKYCGEVLPYPAGFNGQAIIEEVENSNGRKYLHIINYSSELTISDYYKQLNNTGWTSVKDYTGNVCKTDSTGLNYYELNNISSDNSKGYNLRYYFYESDYNLYKYNVIDCFNDLDTTISSENEYNVFEKSAFNSVLTLLPAKLKTGVNSQVYAPSEDDIYVYDSLALDLTSQNVKILQDDNWVIDQDLTTKNNNYVLKKNASDGTSITATIYYFQGNFVKFTYNKELFESTSWPSAFVSEFESKTGIIIPEFSETSAEDINKYFYFKKGGVSYIYAQLEDDIEVEYKDLLSQTSAIYDASKQWFTDWNEKGYIYGKTGIDYNDDYKDMFRIAFSLLEKPYDNIVTSYPINQLNEFFTKNNLTGVNVPTFDFTNYTSNSLRVDISNYEDQYPSCYQEVKEDPSYYNVDEDDEEQIKEAAKQLSKENTKFTIKVYDPLQKSYNYLLSSLKNIRWAKVSDYSYDASYEDENGKLKISVGKDEDITKLVFTYGSGTTHQKGIQFETKSAVVSPGDTYQCDLIVNCIEGNISYTSSNSKFSVDSNGLVSVSEDAKSGEYTLITASITSNGITYTDTCNLAIPENYTLENTINKVADQFNACELLDKGDSGYAIPSLIDQNDSSKGYTFTCYPSYVTSIEEGQSYVEDNLIPDKELEMFSNNNNDEWTLQEDGSYFTDYVAFNDDGSAVDLCFYVFTSSDGLIGIKVETIEW